MIKKILLLSVLTLSISLFSKETKEDNNQKLVYALMILQEIEDCMFPHEEGCAFVKTDVCTCSGEHLATGK